MIALEEKGLQGYNQKLLSFEKGEHKSKEVHDINPRDQLPALKHEDRVVNESIAICLYLENEFKSQGNQLIPDCGKEKAVVYQRLLECLNLQQRFVDVATYAKRVPESERHDSAIKRNREALTNELNLWEGYLKKEGPYLAGKNFSLADVAFFPVIALPFRMGLSHARYPKLSEYHNLVKERPSVKVSWPPHWLESEGPTIMKDL